MRARPGRAARVILFAPALAAGIAGGGAAVGHHAPLAPICATASWSHHAALVVEHGDGRTIRLCIGFDAASITGEDMLRASGLEHGTVSYGSLGDAVCQIDGEPTTYPPSCFTTSGPYWVTFVSRHGGAWAAANLGVSNEIFGDGDAEGFRYDPQTGSAAAPVSPAGTCSMPPSRPAATSGASPRPGSPTPHGGAAATPDSSVAAVASAPTQTPGLAEPTVAPRGRTGALATAAQPLNAGVLAAAVAGGGLVGLLTVLASRRRGPRA